MSTKTPDVSYCCLFERQLPGFKTSDTTLEGSTTLILICKNIGGHGTVSSPKWGLRLCPPKPKEFCVSSGSEPMRVLYFIYEADKSKNHASQALSE